MLARAPWLPVYFAWLAAAVLSPFTISCAPLGLLPEFAPLDFVVNVILFMPVAALFARPRIVASALVGLGISVAIEAAQRYLFRSPNPWDLIANAGGAGAGAVLWHLAPAWLPGRIEAVAVWLWRPMPRRVLGVLLAGAALGGAEVTARLAQAFPRPSFETWAPMWLVLGCEQGSKPNFRGRLTGIAVYDLPLYVPPPNFGALGDYAEGGPIFAVDFTRGEGWLDGPEGRRELALSPPPGLRMGPDGLRLGESCWFFDDASAAHVLERLAGRTTFSIALELALPEDRVGKRARLFAHTLQHSTWNFSVGHRDERLILWFRTGVFRDAYEDPLGETGMLPVVPGDEGIAAFSVDRARVRGYWNGSCRRERLVPMLGRPFPLGRGLGFTLALLVGLGACAGGLLGGRYQHLGVLLGGTSAAAWLYLRGGPAPLLDTQYNLLWGAAFVLVGALLTSLQIVRARIRG